MQGPFIRFMEIIELYFIYSSFYCDPLAGAACLVAVILIKKASWYLRAAAGREGG